MKICSKCQISKPYENFSKKANAPDGFAYWCKSCTAILRKEFREKNREALNQTHRIWYAENKEIAKAYEQLNKARVRRVRKRWEQVNAGRRNALTAKRRAMKLRATPKWLTKEQLAEIQWFYDTAKELQWLAEDILCVDHIEPFAG